MNQDVLNTKSVAGNKIFYTLGELSEMTGAATSTLYLMRERGELIFRKFGGRTVVLKSDFDALVANMPVCPAEPQPTNRRRSRAA